MRKSTRVFLVRWHFSFRKQTRVKKKKKKYLFTTMQALALHRATVLCRSHTYSSTHVQYNTHLASLDAHATAPELQEQLAAGREVAAAVLAAVLPDAVVDRLVGIRVGARAGLLPPLWRGVRSIFYRVAWTR